MLSFIPIFSVLAVFRPIFNPCPILILENLDITGDIIEKRINSPIIVFTYFLLFPIWYYHFYNSGNYHTNYYSLYPWIHPTHTFHSPSCYVSFAYLYITALLEILTAIASPIINSAAIKNMIASKILKVLPIWPE